VGEAAQAGHFTGDGGGVLALPAVGEDDDDDDAGEAAAAVAVVEVGEGVADAGAAGQSGAVRPARRRAASVPELRRTGVRRVRLVAKTKASAWASAAARGKRRR
jgi:hypothetical protein